MAVVFEAAAGMGADGMAGDGVAAVGVEAAGAGEGRLSWAQDLA
ncbi:hypothetical protein J2W51_001539 [Tardiphaga robiniae]|nr:hypothetical protein [Tardiphaga robiniae]